MKLKVNVIDSFTNVAFKGNPAAVIITEQWLTDTLMQSIASENNLSETAFVVPQNKADNESESEPVFDIRWFSPISEVSFCGHATLASAFVMFAQHPTLNSITFFAQAVGKLEVTRATNGFIQMSFPNRAPKPVEKIPDDLLQGLSITPVEVLLNEQAYFAVYANEQDVIKVKSNNARLIKLAPFDVVVTAPAAKGGDINSDYDFISRYFWPANGGNEDPVTGSIHAGLAPFWASKLNKQQLSAFQASQRGGRINCYVDGDRVWVSGQAVQYLEGYIDI
jgi:PhzF family phenazine biosynthesis protein